MNIMGAANEILNMVKEILAYFNEIDAANVVEIVKNAVEKILAGFPTLF